MEMKNRCIAEVSMDRYGHKYRCGNKGKVEREGQHYCKKHDPVAYEKRQEEKMKAYNAMLAEDERVRLMKVYFKGVSEGEINAMIRIKEGECNEKD